MVTVLVGDVTAGIVGVVVTGVVVTVLLVSLVAGILVCTTAAVSSVLAAVFSDEALPQPVNRARKNRDAIKLIYFILVIFLLSKGSAKYLSFLKVGE